VRSALAGRGMTVRVLIAIMAFSLGSASVAFALDPAEDPSRVLDAFRQERPAFLESGEAPIGPVALPNIPGGVNVCTTGDYTARTTQRALVSGWVSVRGDDALTYTVVTVSSVDAGATWMLDSFGWERATVTGAGTWAAASYSGLVTLEARKTYRFGLQLARSLLGGASDSGPGNATNVRCHVIVQITNAQE
jgi:hypothetical protein